MEELKIIGKLLLNPSLIFKGLWDYTVAYSFWVCLLVALLAAVFYALGFKKCAKFVPGSMVVYSLIRMIASAF